MSRKRVCNTFKTLCIERLRPGSHWITNCPIFTFLGRIWSVPLSENTVHSSAKLLSQSMPLLVEDANWSPCNKSLNTNYLACCWRTGKSFVML